MAEFYSSDIATWFNFFRILEQGNIITFRSVDDPNSLLRTIKERCTTYSERYKETKQIPNIKMEKVNSEPHCLRYRVFIAENNKLFLDFLEKTGGE